MIVAGEGGAAPTPLWLVLLGETSRYLTNSHAEPANPWPLHWWRQSIYYGGVTFGIVWGAGFVVAVCVTKALQRTAHQRCD
jgi:hypothetical protein